MQWYGCTQHIHVGCSASDGPTQIRAGAHMDMRAPHARITLTHARGTPAADRCAPSDDSNGFYPHSDSPALDGSQARGRFLDAAAASCPFPLALAPPTIFARGSACQQPG